MDREYFKLWYRLDFEDAYLIWYTDDRDGIVVDSDNGIPSFRSLDALRQYAHNRGWDVDTEKAVLFDLDLVVQWLTTQSASSIDSANTLNAWNLFNDVAFSVGGTHGENNESTGKVYERLFWANNLPSVTPEGERYAPTWTQGELETLRDVLSSGLSLFRGSVSCV